MAIVTRLAIILAAGQGIRLGETGLNGPKAMLEVGGMPLLQRSLRLLSQAGVRQVVLVTGYRARSFESLNVPAGMALTKVHNPDFPSFGSALSLMLALHAANESCLVLDGDIIYEPAALQAALASPAENAMVISSPSGSGDEVHAWAGEHGEMTILSKHLQAAVGVPAGECVGIWKCGNSLRRAMLEITAEMLRGPDPVEYEQIISRATELHHIRCEKVEDLVWAEIDNEEMLVHARDVVYPRIALREARPQFSFGK